MSSEYLKFQEGLDFETSSLRDLFPMLESDSEFANLLQISRVNASEEDLRKVLNNPESILAMRPEQIRTELIYFEEHHPGELVPLKQRIRKMLDRWKALRNNENTVDTSLFLEGRGKEVIVHDLRREVNRGIADLFTVLKARLTTGVMMRTLALPRKNRVEVTTYDTAMLRMLIEVRAGWKDTLAAHENRVFEAHNNVRIEGKGTVKPLFGTPMGSIDSGFGELAPNQLVLVHRPCMSPDDGGGLSCAAQIGSAPHLHRVPISQTGKIRSPREVTDEGFLALEYYMQKTENGLGAKWLQRTPVKPENIRRAFEAPKAALALAASAFVGITGTSAIDRKFS